MYGLINNAIVGKFGQEAWERIAEEAGTSKTFVSMNQYSDEVTYKLVGATSKILNLPAATVLEVFGEYWIEYTYEKGYKKLLDFHGNSLAGFLNKLDEMHTKVKLSYPNLQPPSFSCTEVTDGSLYFHYIPGNAERVGLAPLVIGLLKGLSKHLGITLNTIDQVKHRDNGADHDVFFLEWVSITPPPSPIVPTAMSDSELPLAEGPVYDYSISPNKFTQVFPFHFVMDSDFKLAQIGHVLQRICPEMTIGDSFLSHFRVERPFNFDLKMDSLEKSQSSVFLLSAKTTGKKRIELQGQILVLEPKDYNCKTGGIMIFFVGSPVLASSAQAVEHKLTMNDFALHDSTKDILVLQSTNEATLVDAQKMEQYIFHRIDKKREVVEKPSEVEKKPKMKKKEKCIIM